MTASIRIANFNDGNILEKTDLGADAVAGATTLTLLNNQNITSGATIMIGQVGSETGELVAINSVTGSTIVLTAPTKLNHYKDEPVISILGSKLRIYRAPNINNLPPDDATFTLIATIDIDADQLETTYTDAAGSSAYWYKFTYYNLTSLTETSIGDAVASRSGGGYVSLADIRKEAGFDGASYITDGLIDQKRKTAQGYIDGGLSGQYKVPFDTPIDDTIREITLQYATGLLQISQYGRYGTTNTNNGQSRIDWAEKQVEKIKSGQLILVGVDGIPVEHSPDGSGAGSGAASGYPTTGSTPGFMFDRSFIEDGERHW